MATNVTEEDEEISRQKCENASLEDAHQPADQTTQKHILPPIKLGMSFNDWKQMKEAAEDTNATKSAKERKNTAQQRQNQRTNNPKIPFHNYFHNQNNYPVFRPEPNFYFNAFSKRHNKQNAFQNAMIPSIMPPLIPPPSFEDFLQNDQQWSSGPLMQPMFPPMPRMPRLNQNVMGTNHSGLHNNRVSSQKRPSTRIKPRSGQSNTNSNNNITTTENPSEENITPSEDSRIPPQVYIQRPRNNVNKSDTLKSSWILKPQAPPPMQATTPEMREEKQRLWREYRQAMKPFKNREFANAKRVVQRLGKKTFEELDEKDRARLDRAMEAVNAHKDILNTRMLQRSAKVDHHPPTALHLNYTLDNPIWNNSGTHIGTQPMTGFIPSGFWTPTPALIQPST